VEAQPLFLYDLGDPLCYLAAEQVMSALPVAPEWEPVHAASMGLEPRTAAPAALAEQIAAAGLQPLRWPARWPPDTTRAMLAARYAKQIGRAVAFSLAAFRQAFAGGRDLSEEATILIAAAACEMHPAAVLRGIALGGVRRGLEQASRSAAAAGVRELPAIRVGSVVLQGACAVERAAQCLGAPR
jgi:predicted DsbA family dithiol-disulfide isomerase